MQELNLIRSEYDKKGGPRPSENTANFMEVLSKMLLKSRDGKVSIYDATIAAGFEDEGDEDMFFPIASRLTKMGILKAETVLTTDQARVEEVEGSRREGVKYADPSFGKDGYSQEELTELGFSEDAVAYPNVVVRLAEDLQKAEGKAKADGEGKESGSNKPENKDGGNKELGNKEAPGRADQAKKNDDGMPEIGLGDMGYSQDQRSAAAYENGPSLFGDDTGEASGSASPVAVDAGETGSNDGTAVAEAGILGSTSKAEPAADQGKAAAGTNPFFLVDAYWGDSTQIMKILGKSDRPKARMLDKKTIPESFDRLVEVGGVLRSTVEISDHNLKKNFKPVAKETGDFLFESLTSIEALGMAVGGEPTDGERSEVERILGSVRQVSDAIASTPDYKENHWTLPAKDGGSEPSSEDASKEDAVVGGTDVMIGEGLSRTVLGKTRAKFKRYGILSVGGVAAALVIGLAVREKFRADKLEKYIDNPTTEERVVKRKEYEALMDRVEELTSKNEAMRRERDKAIELEVSKFKLKQDAVVKDAQKKAYDQGNADAFKLTPLSKERLGIITLRHAVINGECEALGRGNRIDRIFPTNLPIDVMYWIVDPSDAKVSGVVGVNDELLKRADGAVTQVRCIIGKADVWPSNGKPAEGKDGQSRPLAQDGTPVETNPLLK